MTCRDKSKVKMDEEPNVWPTLVQCGGDGWLVTMMVMYLDKAW